MRAQIDRDDEIREQHEDRVLWYYKWILEHLHQFHQVSTAQIERTFADMETRYRRAQYSLRPVYKLRCMSEQEMGRQESAAHWHQLWLATEDDYASDCQACDVNAQIYYLANAGDEAAAISMLDEMVKSRRRCTEVPAITFTRMLAPLLRAGRRNDAEAFRKRAQRLVHGSRKFIMQIGDELLYLGLAGEWAKGAAILDEKLRWAQETRRDHERFAFGNGARTFLKRLERSGQQNVSIRADLVPGLSSAASTPTATAAELCRVPRHPMSGPGQEIRPAKRQRLLRILHEAL